MKPTKEINDGAVPLRQHENLTNKKKFCAPPVRQHETSSKNNARAPHIKHMRTNIKLTIMRPSETA